MILSSQPKLFILFIVQGLRKTTKMLTDLGTYCNFINDIISYKMYPVKHFHENSILLTYQKVIENLKKFPDEDIQNFILLIFIKVWKPPSV